MKAPRRLVHGGAGLAALLLAAAPAAAQQVADTAYRRAPVRPAYAAGRGPVVAIDEAHHNFHTAGGRYLAFAELLLRDGYVVRATPRPFTAEALRGVDVLVVANALGERNAERENWALPTPSAVSPDEIVVVRAWVERGGALLLIADHMPFAGAARDLGAAFGLSWSNGFAMEPGLRGPMPFVRADGSLPPHVVRDGRSAAERVDSIYSFTGSAFRAPQGARPVLVLRSGVVSFEPQRAWQFSDSTPRQPAAGWLQGATLVVGRGRVAVFGEAAMFSAQLDDGSRMGMNHPLARRNWQFVLNVLHWLTGLLPG